MLTVKAPNICFTLPTAWEEVTLIQFIELTKAMDITDTGQLALRNGAIISALSSDVNQSNKLGITEEATTFQKLTFLKSMPDFTQKEVPERVAGISVPKDISWCTVLQKWSIEELIEESQANGVPFNIINVAVPMLAIYLYPLLTKTPLTQSSEAEALHAQIEQLPVTEALPLAAFFLISLKRLQPTGKTSYVISSPSRPPKTWLTKWFRNWRSTSNTPS